MQFQVPQFIDIEDKVIGPLTIKQFLYILVAGVILFVLFKLLNFSVFIILSIPVIVLTYALAFVKVHNKPFINVIGNFIGFLRKPDFYVWKKPIIETEEKKEGPPKIIKKEAIKTKKPIKQRLKEVNWKINIQK